MPEHTQHPPPGWPEHFGGWFIPTWPTGHDRQKTPATAKGYSWTEGPYHGRWPAGAVAAWVIPPGIAVLDIDGKYLTDEGRAALVKQARQHALGLGGCLHVRKTPRGGAHLYVDDPDNEARNATNEEAGWDWKAHGGYVVVGGDDRPELPGGGCWPGEGATYAQLAERFPPKNAATATGAAHAAPETPNKGYWVLDSRKSHTEPLEAAQRLLDRLAPHRCDNRDEWLTTLAAVKHAFGDAARGTAEDWSRRSAKYDPRGFATAWDSLETGNYTGAPATMATVQKWADADTPRRNGTDPELAAAPDHAASDARLRRIADDLFDITPSLAAVRQAALHARISPLAALAATLARLSARSHHAFLPPVLGRDPIGVATYWLLTAASGGGKSYAMAVAAQLDPDSAEKVETVTPVSAQGLIDRYMRAASDKNEPDVENGLVAKTGHTAMYHLDELGLLAQTKTNAPALFDLLKTAWVNQSTLRLDVSARQPANRPPLPARTYGLSALLCATPDTAALITDDATGTVQRFAVIPAGLGPWADHDRPPAPNPLEIANPTRHLAATESVRRHLDDHAEHAMTAPPGELADHDGQNAVLLPKLAANIAILDSRSTITDDDTAAAHHLLAVRTEGIARAAKHTAWHAARRDQARGLSRHRSDTAADNEAARQLDAYIAAAAQRLLAAGMPADRRAQYRAAGRTQLYRHADRAGLKGKHLLTAITDHARGIQAADQNVSHVSHVSHPPAQNRQTHTREI